MSDAKTLVKNLELKNEGQVKSDPYGLKIHLMPRVGWLNDPNGLCQWNGTYHIFFQYSPDDPNGGMKIWGHYTTKDFIHYERQTPALYEDHPADKDGVYSGSALIEHNRMYLFYTGNVKQPGDHDYTYTGREANTILVESSDGIHFEPKQVLMTNADYPSDYSCHIRDPKVWKENDTYYMIQGGRKKGECLDLNSENGAKVQSEYNGDKGYVLIFSSKDLKNWSFVKEITTPEHFGFMWECPDTFALDGHYILSCSPQGLEAKRYCYQNVYQAGYFVLGKSCLDTKEVSVDAFYEWDRGYDFYAPQTFLDESGRRILIGWAGIGDAEYDNAPTIEKGWQHTMTLPRELTFQNGKVYQYPIREILELRETRLDTIKYVSSKKVDKEPCIANKGKANADTITGLAADKAYEIQLSLKDVTDATGKKGSETTSNDRVDDSDTTLNNKYTLVDITCADQSMKLTWKEGVLAFEISTASSHGRPRREILLEKLTDISIYLDTSIVEIYVNRGEEVMTSRFYFPVEQRELRVSGLHITEAYALRPFEIADMDR